MFLAEDTYGSHCSNSVLASVPDCRRGIRKVISFPVLQLCGNPVLTSFHVDVLRQIPDLLFSVQRIVIFGMHNTSIVELRGSVRL